MFLNKLSMNRSGFTLVELLVVVAIVGILATVGVPQYKRMVAKSYKAEAKVVLSAIGKGQSAFYAEFGVYGNNLKSMGIETSKSPAQSIYLAGFTYSNSKGAFPTAKPDQMGGFGPRIAQNIAGYYSTYNQDSSELIGRTTRSGSGTCEISTTSDSTYSVHACGTIGAGKNLDTATVAGGGVDIWKLDETGRLTNVVDGAL